MVTVVISIIISMISTVIMSSISIVRSIKNGLGLGVFRFWVSVPLFPRLWGAGFKALALRNSAERPRGFRALVVSVFGFGEAVLVHFQAFCLPEDGSRKRHDLNRRQLP